MPATGRVVFLGIFLAALVSPLAAQSNRPIYLYATNFSSGGPGTVSAFNVNSSTGALSPVPGSPFPAGSGPSGVVVDPTGRFVYVTNGGSNDIWGYSVNAATGALTPFPGSPFIAGNSPATMAVDPTGRFLYVSDVLPDKSTNALYLRAYLIDGSTGVLTVLPGSPYPAPDFLSAVTFNPHGTFVYLGELRGPIVIDAVNFQTGVPTPAGGPGRFNGVSSIAVTPQDQFAYAVSQSTGSAGFTVDPITGSLNPLPSSSVPLPSGGQAATVDPSGKFLYFTALPNAPANNSATISAFQIDPESGALTQVSGSPYTAGSSLPSIVVDPSGHFVYAVGLTSSGPGVYGFARNLSSGALTPLAGSPWLTGPDGLVGASDTIAVAFAPTSSSNPLPSISSLVPFAATAGGAGFDLTVNGANFVPGSTVHFGGIGRVTTYVNSTQLAASILPADIAKGGTDVVFVFNPPPGGGASPPIEFPVSNPVPIVTSINPPTVTAGGPGFVLEVDGSNFTSDSVVNYNGSARTTTHVSATALQVDVASADILTPGSASITVTNPATNGLGGGTSSAARLNIAQSTIQPVIGHLSPGSATAGDQGFTLTITGSGFTSNSTVRFGTLNVPVTAFSPTQLQVSVPAGDIAVAGAVLVSVSVPGVGVSVAATFQVNNPAPGVGSVSPPSVPAGSTALTLMVTGTNFTPNSAVLVNDSARQTTYVNSTTLQAQLPASDFAAGGTLKITVSNPTPGGGTSVAMALTVTDYMVTATSTSTSVSAGQLASFSFTVAPSGGSFTNPATFTASNLPPMASASFTPSSPITPGSSSVPVTASVSTTAHSSASLPVPLERRLPRLPVSAVWMGVLGMLGWMWSASSGRKRRLVQQFALACLLLIATGLSSCGGVVSTSSTTSSPQLNPNTGPPAGTYTITVTATSGGVSHATNVTLTVM